MPVTAPPAEAASRAASPSARSAWSDASNATSMRPNVPGATVGASGSTRVEAGSGSGEATWGMPASPARCLTLATGRPPDAGSIGRLRDSVREPVHDQHHHDRQVYGSARQYHAVEGANGA